MEIDRVKRSRTIGSVAAIVVLMLIAAGCATTLIIAARAAGATLPGSAPRKAFARLALLSTATLGLSLVLLVWWAARLMSYLLRPTQGPHAPTPHVDAWSVAGKRFRLDEDDDEDDEDDEEEDEPTDDAPPSR